MVIRGKPRGNGSQLASYLLTMKDNENIRVLQVSGRYSPTHEDVREAIFDMDIMAELSNAKLGLYHAQINPDLDASQTMEEAKWFHAADILEKQLGLEGQPRVIVMHEKKGRLHTHVVWQRFDEQTQTVRSDSFSRLAQDRARKEMERVFEQKETPHRNKHRPELKAAMLDCWQQTKTGKDFVKKVSETGYMVAAGSMRNPFMVVDENGRTFDLNRQIKGVRLKEIRERMKGVKLVSEKEAIEIMRQKKADGGNSGTRANRQDDKEEAKKTAKQFADNRNEAIYGQEDIATEKARQFAENRNEAVYGADTPKPEQGTKQQEKKTEEYYSENAEAVKKEKAQEAEQQTAPEPETSFEQELRKLRERNKQQNRERGRKR